MLTRNSVRAAASLALLTVMTTGCSFNATLGPQVKKADIETRLTQEISAQTGKPASISCPGNLKGKQGEAMECSADIAGQSYPVAVTVTSVNDGNVNYSYKLDGGQAPQPTAAPTSPRPPATPRTSPNSGTTPASGKAVPKINIEVRVGNEIRQRTGQSAVVECPRDLAGEVGDTMTCTASIVGDKRSVVVTAESIEGNNVNYSYKVI